MSARLHAYCSAKVPPVSPDKHAMSENPHRCTLCGRAFDPGEKPNTVHWDYKERDGRRRGAWGLTCPDTHGCRERRRDNAKEKGDPMDLPKTEPAPPRKTDRAALPLDPKLRHWLTDELNRRELPPHWLHALQQLVSWAQTYRDGEALHALLLRYPRTKSPPETAK